MQAGGYELTKLAAAADMTHNSSERVTVTSSIHGSSNKYLMKGIGKGVSARGRVRSEKRETTKGNSCVPSPHT